jgi:predicted enzyme related to lactoylglutathione lyase
MSRRRGAAAAGPRDPSASAPVLVGEILDIPNVGRYARVQDSEGNVIGVIKPFMR